MANVWAWVGGAIGLGGLLYGGYWVEKTLTAPPPPGGVTIVSEPGVPGYSTVVSGPTVTYTEPSTVATTFPTTTYPSAQSYPLPDSPGHLPTSFPRQCGTAYWNLGYADASHRLSWVGKYVHSKWVVSYAQPYESTYPVNAIVGGSACTSPTQVDYYTVQSGDTLSLIALRTGSTVAELTALNHLANPNYIVVGEVLQVPNPYDSTLGGTDYTSTPSSNPQIVVESGGVS